MRGAVRIAIRSVVMALLVLCLPIVSGAGNECICRGPERPEMPSRRADAVEMAQAAREIEQFVGQMKAYRACVARCLTEADGTLAAYVEEWNRSVEGYNERAGSARKERVR